MSEQLKRQLTNQVSRTREVQEVADRTDARLVQALGEIDRLRVQLAKLAVGGSEGAYRMDGRTWREVAEQAEIKLAKLVEAARAVLIGIDNWEAAVEKIIGRQPNVDWGDLERLRAVLDEIERLDVEDKEKP